MRFDYLVSFCFYNTILKRHIFRSVYLKEGEFYFGNMGHPNKSLSILTETSRFEQYVRIANKSIETEFTIISISNLKK